ncbi:MAG: energy transducer TonB [Bacteroidetes bacterium]|nr:energy transducer TonB [Bacteroidota bacterium]
MKRYKEIILITILSFIYIFNNQAFSQNIENFSDTDTIVFYTVQNPPTFINGDTALLNFLTRNLKWPNSEIDVEGTVYISFIVEKDGSLTNINILRGIQNKFDQEAIRVIKLMPKWIAGEQKGKKVRVRYNLPIKFINVEK